MPVPKQEVEHYGSNQGSKLTFGHVSDWRGLLMQTGGGLQLQHKTEQHAVGRR